MCRPVSHSESLGCWAVGYLCNQIMRRCAHSQTPLNLSLSNRQKMCWPGCAWQVAFFEYYAGNFFPFFSHIWVSMPFKRSSQCMSSPRIIETRWRASKTVICWKGRLQDQGWKLYHRSTSNSKYAHRISTCCGKLHVNFVVALAYVLVTI